MTNRPDEVRLQPGWLRRDIERASARVRSERSFALRAGAAAIRKKVVEFTAEADRLERLAAVLEAEQ